MQREIKFRAWGINSKEFLGYVEDGALVTGLTLANIQNIEAIDLWEFQQYTGLKDKNGKVIYEGDIGRYHSPVGAKYDLIFAVKWDNEKARFGESYADGIYDGSFIRSGKSEVIGNIYENPELLTA
ncbi:MAG: DNA-packaging protein [Sphingopyxis sp.]|nr:DNA-packaging protein [Sphingopyxis sp.]